MSLNLDSDIKLGDLVGEGGTASVFQGQLLKTSKIASLGGIKDVAIKIPRSDISQSDKDSFLYEVAITSNIPKSPNLVLFVGYSEVPLAAIIKYYPFDLKTLLKDSSELENKKMFDMKMAIDIASGMKLLHSAGILHLDLKTGMKPIFTGTLISFILQ